MKHVLIVDDNPEILEMLYQILHTRYRVSCVKSGHEALEFLDTQIPDIILLDQDMPNLTGYETMIEIMKNDKIDGIPIILLTEPITRDNIDKAMKSGAVDYIVKPVLPEVLLNRVRTYIDLNEYRTNMMMMQKFQDAIAISLAELVECRDEATGGHIKNTTLYFEIMLVEMIEHENYKDVITYEDVRDLLRSVPLHDIGKIGINDEILRKSSSLDDNEFEYMKTHTILGRETFDKIIRQTGGTKLLYLAKDLAYCHHERWDGTGYPNGLKGEEIPIYARILSIADVYDALTSRRSYKEAYSHEKAREIILQGRGTLFDPKLVDIFDRASERFKEALLKRYQEEEGK